MMRIRNWPQALDEYVRASRHKPFAYGIWDCGKFAAGAVLAVTGIDVLEQLGTYDSKIEAYKAIARFGSLEALVTALLRVEPTPASHCQRGDVALLDVSVVVGNEGPALGICLGPPFAMTGERDLAFVDVSKVLMTWRVG